jgi:hypothetical protein
VSDVVPLLAGFFDTITYSSRARSSQETPDRLAAECAVAASVRLRGHVIIIGAPSHADIFDRVSRDEPKWTEMYR